jgi:hypothetical protein
VAFNAFVKDDVDILSGFLRRLSVPEKLISSVTKILVR